MPSDPLPRRTSKRRRGASTAPEPMDWGAWLEGARPGHDRGTGLPGQRAGSEPVLDLREVPSGTLAAGLTDPAGADPRLDLTGAERAAGSPVGAEPASRRSRRAAGQAGPARSARPARPARPEAAAPGGPGDPGGSGAPGGSGEQPLTRRARRRLEQPDPAPAADPVAAAGFPAGRGRGVTRPTDERPIAQPDGDGPRADRRRGRWVLPVLAGLLVLTSLTCLLDTPVSVLVAIATFCPVVALAAVPVIAFGARGRRWVTVAAAAAAALLPWGLVVGYALPGPSPTVPAGQKIRVLTVNAQFGKADPEQIVSAVQKMGVDVLVVTELTNQLAHDLTPAGLPGLLQPRWVDVDAPAAGGIGVWSRFEASGVQPLTGTRWPAAKLTLTTPGGPVELVATHVSPPVPGPSAASWRKDLSVLTDAAGSGDAPRLVVGDLNATPWHAPFRRLTGHGLHDAADVLGHGLRNTWPAWAPAPLTALDHVLVGGPVDVTTVDTVAIDGTDHRALVVRLTVPGADGD
jgi:endonuclease/exonuclease/phosphatase (EEP) superfamily protein YafD